MDENFVRPESVQFYQKCINRGKLFFTTIILIFFLDRNYNPKYEVQMSESTNSMFPNYHAPDSIIAIEAQQQQALEQNSVKSAKSMKAFATKISTIDSPEREKPSISSRALRDIFTCK